MFHDDSASWAVMLSIRVNSCPRFGGSLCNDRHGGLPIYRMTQRYIPVRTEFPRIVLRKRHRNDDVMCVMSPHAFFMLCVCVCVKCVNVTRLSVAKVIVSVTDE
jgi:hypothetical protein